MADGSVLTAPIEEAFAAPKRKSKAKAGSRKVKPRKVKVDFWATDFNSAEIGVMKRTQNEAASDQFTKDMELYGQTVVNGKRESLIGFRQELWDGSADFDRRLVIRLFSESLSWRGSVEMLLGRSLQLSLAAGGLAIPVYSVNLARHDQLIQIERSARKLPLMPETWSFFIQGKSGPRFYKLRRNVFALGSDYSIYTEKGRKIGEVDSKVVNLGGAWMMKIDPAYSDKKLEAVLELFCATLKFKGEARRHIRRLTRLVQGGKLVPDLTHNEADLYENPRKHR